MFITSCNLMRAYMWDFVDRNLILKRETIENIIFFFVYTTHTKQMRLILSLFGHVWQVKTPHNCAGPVNDMKSVFVIIILFKVDTCVYACASSFRLLSLVWIYFVRTMCVHLLHKEKSRSTKTTKVNVRVGWGKSMKVLLCYSSNFHCYSLLLDDNRRIASFHFHFKFNIVF